MMLDRRNHLRRAVSSGVVVGAVAAVLLMIFEVLWMHFGASSAVAVAGGTRWLAPPLLGLAAGAGALVGAAQGLVVALVTRLAESFSRTRRTLPRWKAAFYTLAATPAIAVVCAEAFSGRRAQALPMHQLLAVGVGVVLMALSYLACRLVVQLADALHKPPASDEERSRRWALLLAAALVGVAGGLYAADRLVLVRLYPFFHVGLELVAFSALELAVLSAALGLRAGERRWARICAPRAALGLLLFALAAAAFSLAVFQRDSASPLRVVAYEHGAVGANLLDFARRAGLGTDDVMAASLPGDAAASLRAAPAPARPTPTRPGADVILVTVDALRADHLGAYGYDRPVSPNIDALARQGTVFENAYTVVPHTSFSVASLLIGKYAWSLARLGLLEGHETLPDILRRYRYKTAAFFTPAVFYVDGEQFTEYKDRSYGFEYVKFEPFKEHLDAPARTDQVIDFFQREKPQRALVWVHYFGPHEPYLSHPEVGEPFGTAAVDRYDEEIRWVDMELGRLLEYLDRTRPGAIVVLAADHGEEFGDHGGAYHGATLYDEQIRVPLIIRVPDLAGQRVAAPVSTVDVVPTVLSLVDVPVPARVRGIDLTPWMAEEPAPESDLPPVFAEIGTQKAVMHGTDKLVCDVERSYCRLFDRQADPRELVDVAPRRHERVIELRGFLSQWMASHSEYERLEERPDPAAEARRHALERGELGDREAGPELAALVADDAAPVEDRVHAARLLARLEDEEAAEALRAAREGADPRLRAWAEVALLLLGSESARGVVAELDEALLEGDPELRARAAMALARAGHPRAVPELLRALDVVELVSLRIEILRALGRTRDHRAAEALKAHYEYVRTRRHSVYAMADLRDASLLPFLSSRLEDDEYTSVRAAIAHALASIGDGRGVAPLRRAFEREGEGQVVAATADALARLGAARRVGKGTAAPRPREADEIWIVTGDDAAGLEVTLLGRRREETVRVNTDVTRKAYPVALPEWVRRVRVGPPATYVLFRSVPRHLRTDDEEAPDASLVGD